ncbi:adenylosuccinate lyase [Candidatus Peregrinibacteria bacterium]|nr:adenylosuccinate lyase [Candidatus Peregrinibacteria bacterium]
MLSALSPLDGRYRASMEELRVFFSEEALIRARIFIEISYFAALAKEPKLKELKPLKPAQEKALQKIIDDFSPKDAEEVKKLEQTTRHDVKAVEYFLKKKIEKIPGLKDATEFVHFALTSEDTNNLAYGILIHQAIENVLAPTLLGLLQDLAAMAVKWKTARMLSLTHGQPATPTTVGKEMLVFATRLQRQLALLDDFRMQGKFGGAVGTYSAHEAAYPDVDWEKFGKEFVTALGLTHIPITTQINPHDDLAELSHLFIRMNTILLDFSRDMWLYISRGVFKQAVVKGEVGSSTMPHKVNPIDFENGEGNLGLSNALFDHFALKLPVSRLQRDLSDSTVQRNIGVAFGYHILAVQNIQKGLGKLTLDASILQRELDLHPEVAAEAIQTVLRKHGVHGAYEKLKALTRGEKLTKEDLRSFVEELKLPPAEKKKLLGLL